jgi:hypothetical protein
MRPAIVKFVVRKSIDEVFELISDIAHYNDWAPQSSMVYYGTTITSRGAKGLNTAFADRMRFGCKSIGKIVRYDPPKRFAIDQTTFSIVPLFSSHIDYQLTSDDQMTQVCHTVVPKTHGIYKLLNPIHKYLLVKERNNFCRAIIQRLEKNI